MTVLYVDSPGSTIRLKGDCIQIDREGVEAVEMPVSSIEQALLVGDAHITGPARVRLLKQGVAISFLSNKGNFSGKLFGSTHKNVFLRMAQYQRYHEMDFRLAIARSVIWTKGKNNLEFVQKHQRSHRDKDLSSEIEAIKQELPRIWHSDTIESLLGYEGIMAKNYFAAFGKMLRQSGFSMNGRSRRPPKDAVNAMLSLGYTLLYNDTLGSVEAIGFDPYIGFLHELGYGRASLACDIMEEFRFVVDELVAALINLKVIKPDDITEQNGGWFLNDKARKVFYRSYDEKLRTVVNYGGHSISYRQVVVRQAERLARVVKGSEYVYAPYHGK